MTNQAANRRLSIIEKTVAHLPGGRRNETPANILVIRWGNLGDIIVALPAFHALRRLYPRSRLVLLTTPTQRGAPGAREVLANDPTFDEVITYYADEAGKASFLLGLLRALAAMRIDLAVALANQLSEYPGLAKYLALLGAAGVRRFEGFRLYSDADYEIRQAERLVNVIRPLGDAEVEPLPWLTLDAEAKARARQLLGDTGPGPVVIMHCGSKPPVNRWRPVRFAELGRMLAEEQGARIVLSGSRGERELAETVALDIGKNVLNLAGMTSLRELFGVVELADLVIANDTGVMHVAYALKRPVVAIFSGRSRPMVWRPFGDSYVALREEIECSPCYSDVCPLYEYPECLDRIGTGAAFRAAVSLLDHA